MSTQQPKTPKFPPPEVPTIFADGVLNHAHTAEMVKFYLGRVDPSENQVPGNDQCAIAQVVLPMTGFLEMVSFFNTAVEAFITDGSASRAAWEAFQQKHARKEPAA